ncbi:MAG: CHAT domain-containing protein [Saprospiraceae bacterium]|nr:CHAT domain-containing protein [Saprospiraceae bacterium]
MKIILLGILLILVQTSLSKAQVDNLTIQKELDELYKLTEQSFYAGEYDQGLNYAIKSVEVSKQLGQTDTLYAGSLTNLSAIYAALGKTEGAKETYELALGSWELIQGGKHKDYAITLNNYAAFYDDLGDVDEAESAYYKAIEILTTNGNDVDKASSLNNLAILYKNQSRYSEAIPLYKEAIKIYEENQLTKERHYDSFVLNLAKLYINQSNIKEAQKLIHKMDSVYKDLGADDSDQVLGITTKANIYYQADEFKKSNDLYFKVINRTSNASSLLYYDWIASVGFNYLQLRDYANAKLYFNKVLNTEVSESIYKKAKLRSLLGLAQMFYNKSEYEESEKYYLLTIQKNLDRKDFLQIEKMQLEDFNSYINQETFMNSLLGLDKVYSSFLSKGNIDKEVKSIYIKKHKKLLDLCLGFFNTIRQKATTKKDKLKILNYNKQISECYSKLVLFALQSNNTAEEKVAMLGDAFNALEQNRTMLMRDLEQNDLARNLGEVPDSLLKQEKVLLGKISEFDKKIAEAKNAEERTELDKKRSDYRIKFNQLNQKLAQEFPQYHKIKYQDRKIDIPTVQGLLKSGEILLEYSIHKNKLYVYSISSSEVYLEEIEISEKELNKRVRNLRSSLSDYQTIKEKPEENYTNFVDNAYWFYENLVAPALKDNKEVKHLSIITDGTLGHLPFEVFLTTKPEQKTAYKDLPYLIKQYSINYHNSAILMQDVYAKKRQSNNKKSLGFAPSYKKGTREVTTTSISRSMYMRGLRKQLSPLFGTKDEVKTLSEIFHGDYYLNKDATEAKFKEEAPKYSIIHLAMHGMLSKGEPLLSSLVFTEDNDTLEDNFLQFHEISKLDLNADLVVLSACETGYGKFEQGEGILSLAHSFLYAGVPSLVMSLWKVNDQSTKEIMTRFYTYLGEGSNKPMALQKAKLEYLTKASGEAAHPAYWSAFVQVGKPDSIKKVSSGGSNLWLGIGGGILILFGGWLLMRRKQRAE